VPLEPQIIRNEGGLVVVDKPSGLPSTGRDLTDPRSVQAWLQRTLDREKVWAVHQLDQDTSGLNLFVLKKPLVPEWSERLAAGRKTYLAIVHGRARDVTVDAPIGVRREGRKTFPVIRSDGDPAITEVEVVDATDEASLVAARPRTGRTHQVRLHLAHVGHPLYGERMHRDPPCEAHPRHALHAWRFRVGDTSLEAAPPEDFAALAKRLGLEIP
jgi:23S rRNA-/tRNA-specific pseudouridylate synthase